MASFKKVAEEIASLVESKNTSYGDSYSKSAEIMKILYPNGIPPSKYMDALAIVRILDKLNRLANDKMAFKENPWEDIMGYALRAVYQSRVEQEEFIIKINKEGI